MLRVDPASVIRRILDGQRTFRHLEWAEGVHHDGQLVGVFRADRRLCAARMRTVRNAVRMQRDRAELDALPAHEFARRVVEPLVRIHVAVVVRRRNGFRMEIVGARTEGAHHEAVALKRLMHRRRLVHASYDWLEVHDVERPGIELAVPSHDVTRIVIEHDLVQSVVLFHDNREIAHLVEGSQLARNADVALGIRSALDELAVLVSVALRRPRVPLSLDDEQLRLTARRIEAIPVHDAAMQHDVIALAEREVTVLRLDLARPLRDVHDLVSLRVAIEVLVGLVGLDVVHRDVCIDEQRHAIERRASLGRDARRAEMPVAERLVGIGLDAFLTQAPHGVYGWLPVNVIQEGRRSRKAFLTDELLGIQAAIPPAERDVALSGNLSERVIEGHRAPYRLPRSSCSRSMASNSALKLPAPKLRAPFR